MFVWRKGLYLTTNIVFFNEQTTNIYKIYQSYQPKSKIRRDCNQCVCARGKWVCTKNICDGVCSTFGDRFALEN